MKKFIIASLIIESIVVIGTLLMNGFKSFNFEFVLALTFVFMFLYGMFRLIDFVVKSIAYSSKFAGKRGKSVSLTNKIINNER